MAVGMGLLGALGIPDPSPILVGDTGAGAPVRQSEWVAGACAPALHSSASGVLPPQDRISWDTSERTAARGVIAVRRTTLTAIVRGVMILMSRERSLAAVRGVMVSRCLVWPFRPV